jgi:hypothetical protein
VNSVEVLFRELHDVRVFYSQFLSIKVSPSRDTTGSMELITNFMQLPVFYSFSVLYTTITQFFFSVTHYTPEGVHIYFQHPSVTHYTPEGIHIFFNTPSYTQFLYSQINGYNFLHHSKNQRIKLTLL